VFNPGEKAVSARFALNVAAKNMTLLAGDRLKISNHEENYAIEMPDYRMRCTNYDEPSGGQSSGERTADPTDRQKIYFLQRCTFP